MWKDMLFLCLMANLVLEKGKGGGEHAQTLCAVARFLKERLFCVSKYPQ